MLNKTLSTKYTNSLKWNAAEIIIFKCMYILNQIFLLKNMGAVEYGAVGALFAFFYFITRISNFGLDNSLGTLFNELIKDRATFGLFLKRQLSYQVILLSTISLTLVTLRVAGSYFMSIPSDFLHKTIHLLQTIDSKIFCIVIILLFIETIKNIIKRCYLLAFLNQQAAYIQLSLHFLYFFSIWSLFLLGFKLTPLFILSCFLFSTVLNFLLLTKGFYNWYCMLPSNEHTIPYQESSFIQNRILNTFNTIGQNVFTGNFFVLLTSYKFGLEAGAIMKITTTMLDATSIILRKIFGNTSYALFSYIKGETIENQKKAFSYTINLVIQSLYCLLLFLGINFQKIITMKNISGIEFLELCVIYAIGHIIYIYEQFYFTQNRAGYLFIFNAISLLFYGAAIYFSTTHSITGLLLTLIIVRFASLLLISAISYYTWGIKSTLRIKPLPIVGAFLFSLLFLTFA